MRWPSQGFGVLGSDTATLLRALSAPIVGAPTSCYDRSHEPRARANRPRQPAGPRAPGVLRALGRRTRCRRGLQAAARADEPDPPAVPGDAGAVAAGAVVGQGPEPAASAGSRHALAAAEAARGRRLRPPGA